ncbi:hypothetical protein BTO05_08360 [Winogradskyella sp. PC-19]|jgi:hypothetical protein|uniref:hypothetical protein n=1 Tax=unclassified Winogradskyella TaxID=2615021 RepID=UPI000B3D477F|nr:MULTISPECIES: hypothetical protein [unclassified Winogradskyella]ARV09652.1 hypothetical protein BTO05_08360 [Winogradskyella sp. PC-19]RZN77363.1 MAG: hypothetical protein EVB12_06065 [Winogradskyella sp.]
MKFIRKTFRFLSLAIISVSFSQCASTMELQKEAPTDFGEVYCQSWVAGVKGGGSGTNIFIETKSNDLVLDSVYFRGKISNLETKPSNKQLFIGRFLSTSNTEKYNFETASSDKGNDENFPFTLNDNECVVSYTVDGKTKYYKIGNIIERQTDALPMSTLPNKN